MSDRGIVRPYQPQPFLLHTSPCPCTTLLLAGSITTALRMEYTIRPTPSPSFPPSSPSIWRARWTEGFHLIFQAPSCRYVQSFAPDSHWSMFLAIEHYCLRLFRSRLQPLLVQPSVDNLKYLLDLFAESPFTSVPIVHDIQQEQPQYSLGTPAVTEYMPVLLPPSFWSLSSPRLSLSFRLHLPSSQFIYLQLDPNVSSGFSLFLPWSLRRWIFRFRAGLYTNRLLPLTPQLVVYESF